MAGLERSEGRADRFQNLTPYPAASRVMATLEGEPLGGESNPAAGP
jgi:hypothetical protein